MDADLVERAMNAFSAAGVDYGTAFDGIEVDKNGQQGLLADENSKISSPDRAGRMLSRALMLALMLDAHCVNSRDSPPLQHRGAVHLDRSTCVHCCMQQWCDAV